jgi:hypothetical protein
MNLVSIGQNESGATMAIEALAYFEAPLREEQGL